MDPVAQKEEMEGEGGGAEGVEKFKYRRVFF